MSTKKPGKSWAFAVPDNEGWRHRQGGLVLLAGTSACLVLLAVAGREPSYHSPTLSAAIETLTTFSALAGAWLVGIRFRQTRRLQDLLLFGGYCSIGLMNLWLGSVAPVVDLQAAGRFAVATAFGHVLVAAVFASSAFAPAKQVASRIRHPLAPGLVATFGMSCVVGLAGTLVGGRLSGITGNAGQTVNGAFGHPVALLLLVVPAGLFLSAAVRLSRVRRRHLGGPATLEVATLLLAFACVYEIAPHSIAPGRITADEFALLVASGLLLTDAVRQEMGSRRLVAKAAALAERGRVARDLHDGLAQDLALIAALGPQMAEQIGADHPVVIAANRALAFSRCTIVDLSDHVDATLHEALETVAIELRERFQIDVVVDAHFDDDLERDARGQITRIVREAVANAARHGGARRVVVSVRPAHGTYVLRVSDDGRGIGDDRDRPTEGFGLKTMRERAASLGGDLNIREARGGGTELEVVLP